MLSWNNGGPLHSPPKPPHPTSSPWLHIAAPVGKFGASFCIVASFAALLAPIVFLLNIASPIQSAPVQNPSPVSSLIALFSDAGHVLAISDFIAIVGVSLLTFAMFLVLLAFVRGDKPMSLVTFASGAVVMACLGGWVPVMAVAQGQSRGTITSVEAAAATGGWGVASVLLLAAGLAYLFLTLRVENGIKKRRLTSLWWPVYGAVNLLGSVAIASVFAGDSSGRSVDALSLGLVLKVTLVPMLGVMAYGDLKDRFPRWEHVPLMEPPPVEPAVPVAVDAVYPPPPMGILVPPPPPETEMFPPLVTVTPQEPVRAPRTLLPPPPPAE